MQIDNPVNAHSPITQDEISIGISPKDSAALKLVVQQFEKTSSWLEAKQWRLHWRTAQLLYDPPMQQKFWEGTNVPQSNVNIYTTASLVKSIEPQIMNGLFADDPPFDLDPRPRSKQEEARAIKALIHYELEACGFREEMRLGIRDCLTFGTSVWKWNWTSFTRKRRVYKRKADPVEIDSDIPGVASTLLHTKDSDTIEVEEVDEDVDRPTFEHLDLRHVYVDPGCRWPDIRKAKFVIHRLKVSAEELENLRKFEGYDIPAKDKLMALLFPPVETSPLAGLELTQTANFFDHQAVPRDEDHTVDPTVDEKFELLEYWDDNKVIVTLDRKLVIRNERNPYERVPFVSVNWWDIPNSFYGLGIADTCGSEQTIQKGLIDAHLDETWFNLNLPVFVQQGKNIPVQNIRMALGKFVKVEDVNGIKPMPRMEAVPEAFAEVQSSQARAESTSGANELIVQGNMPESGRSSITRTATGANLLAGGSGARLEAFVERIADQVFIPTLDAFYEMNRELLPLDQLRQILSEEMEEAYEGDHLEVFDIRVIFDVKAAARMQSRRQMAQSLPMLTQLLITDPMHSMLTQQGLKLDVNELVNMYMDVSRWQNKADLIVQMTPEDEQRSAMQNPGVQKMLAQQQEQQGDLNNKLSVVDSENAARAFRELMRQAMEKSGESEIVNGQPGNVGFGSQG